MHPSLQSPNLRLPVKLHTLQVKGALEGKKVVAVAAGREHALAVTDEGRVYSWGGREVVCGRPGGAEGYKAPGLVGGDLAKDKVLFVAGGEVRHCYVGRGVDVWEDGGVEAC